MTAIFIGVSYFHFNYTVHVKEPSFILRGARHGHSMKAKQDRIARMEAKLLREMTATDGGKR